MSDTWKLVITRVDNGFVLDGRADEGDAKIKWTIQDDERDELKSGEELLWTVADYFGLLGGRHDKERLHICRKRGDKHEGPEEPGEPGETEGKA